MYSVSQISSRWESKGYFAAARYFLLAIKIFYDIMLEYKISASVAQLDRALASDARCRGFESLGAHQTPNASGVWGFCFGLFLQTGLIFFDLKQRKSEEELRRTR